MSPSPTSSRRLPRRRSWSDGAARVPCMGVCIDVCMSRVRQAVGARSGRQHRWGDLELRSRTVGACPQTSLRFVLVGECPAIAPPPTISRDVVSVPVLVADAHCSRRSLWRARGDDRAPKLATVPTAAFKPRQAGTCRTSGRPRMETRKEGGTGGRRAVARSVVSRGETCFPSRDAHASGMLTVWSIRQAAAPC